MKQQPLEHAELIFQRIVAEANGFGLEICEEDFTRPWGGFLRFTEESLPAFFKAYWQGVDTGRHIGRRDPKVLLVAPGQRLSLQLHHRRSELWRVLDGPVLVIHGPDRDNLEAELLFTGDVIHLKCGEMHRLCADLNSWGRVAEIWEHVDPENPSNEKDIVRIQDDYAR
jgi:mannose-6-phosphate isomerase-like protein (cupin superfamily)